MEPSCILTAVVATYLSIYQNSEFKLTLKTLILGFPWGSQVIKNLSFQRQGVQVQLLVRENLTHVWPHATQCRQKVLK